jgi:exopolysaccharide biosynthesis polyprenyl glycosylphosphotransferase
VSTPARARADRRTRLLPGAAAPNVPAAPAAPNVPAAPVVPVVPGVPGVPAVAKRAVGASTQLGADRWQRLFVRRLFVGDVAVAALGAVVALLVLAMHSGMDGSTGTGDEVLAGVLVLAWPIALAGARCYEMRYLGTGAEEFKRLGTGTLVLTALVGAGAFTLDAPVSRAFVALAVPATGLALLLVRFVQRTALHRRRAAGQWIHRVLAVGTDIEVAHLVAQSRLEPSAGFVVVGSCLVHRPVPERGPHAARMGVPRVGDPRDAAVVAREIGADTIAVLHAEAVGPGGLRRLAWQLEGTSVQLLLSPKLTDIAGPRVTIRPLVGLPLLHVDRPDLSGFRGLLKTVLDRSLAAVLAVLLAPLLLLLALAIRLDSPGPVLFRQVRVGVGGRTFRCLKLRTMVADAEARLPELAAHNEHDGVLFKMRADPRITRVGKWLRRMSLDELPQLGNVLIGQMSLVGPRPPLPAEVDRYASEVRRRLLVKPGITGLWQVSGRSNLSWDDSVRLDLYYVENWSPMLDLSILAKTVVAVFKGSGAF